MAWILFLLLLPPLALGNSNDIVGNLDDLDALEELELTKVKKKKKLYVGPVRFIGRVTDFNDNNRTLKVFSRNKNIKLLRSGDGVKFKRAEPKARYCSGSVRNVEEKDYMVIYATDLTNCKQNGLRLRRGDRFFFHSLDLAKRVYNARDQQKELTAKRKILFQQLEEINNFIWFFKEEKLKVKSHYQKKMAAVYKAEERAMARLQDKRRDSILLQKELKRRIDKLGRDIEFHTTRQKGPMDDSWTAEVDFSLPISGTYQPSR